MEELDFLTTFKNLLKGWWKIVVLAYLAALVGLVVSYLVPATYEAQATFNATIDFSQINFENLVGEGDEPLRFTQYDEDLALQVVERFAIAAKNDSYDYALTLDPTLSREKFESDMKVQRYHANWILSYRHADPAVAQAVVNFWADVAWQALQNAQANGEAEPYVIVNLVSEAALPEKPLYQNRGSLVLAGSLIGFVAGVLLVDGRWRFGGKPQQEA